MFQGVMTKYKKIGPDFVLEAIFFAILIRFSFMQLETQPYPLAKKLKGMTRST